MMYVESDSFMDYLRYDKKRGTISRKSTRKNQIKSRAPRRT